MIDFFQDAPVGAVVLFAAGCVIFLIEAPLRLRWKVQMERREDGPVSEEPSRLPLPIAPLPWVLIVAGLAWYVLTT